MLAFLKREQGAYVVANVLDAAKIGKVEVIMHKANLLEVYYDLIRTTGKDRAGVALAEIKKRSIIIIAEITDELFAEAGRLKTSYKVSFADTFALAQAIVSDAELLTSDHHEFDALVGKENIRFMWIR